MRFKVESDLNRFSISVVSHYFRPHGALNERILLRNEKQGIIAESHTHCKHIWIAAKTSNLIHETTKDISQ
jgi:hypothetical protein